MRDLFPEYSEPPTDYAAIWAEATFVFDTNVLINLYRYGGETRKDFLGVLQKLSDRLWIPYHVALEFYRNRPVVIAEQLKLFTNVRNSITTAQKDLTNGLEQLHLEKRHSSIRANQLIDDMAKLIDEFFRKLSELEKTQQTLTGDDPLRRSIEALFAEHTGVAPTKASIEAMLDSVDERYKRKVPPGYKDVDKDKEAEPEFVHGGICYKRKYGDVIVWKQTLERAKSANLKSIVFVTSDSKEDWFQQIECNGSKTIGPRPELIEEARREAAVDVFLIYTAEQFLKFARTFVAAQVTDQSIAEVRDIAVSNLKAPPAEADFRVRVVRALWRWAHRELGYNEMRRSIADYKTIRLYRRGKRATIGFVEICTDRSAFLAIAKYCVQKARGVLLVEKAHAGVLIAIISIGEELVLTDSERDLLAAQIPADVHLVAGNFVANEFVPTFHFNGVVQD